MKKLILLLFSIVFILAFAKADSNIFMLNPIKSTTVYTGSGSGVGTVSSEELAAWDVLYATIPKDTLASRLQKGVHRFYIARKGLNIGWKFFENRLLEAIEDENLQITPAPTEIEAWDNLYRVASTQNLRWLIRYKDHKKYVRDKNWEDIYIRKEENYIEVIKEKLSIQ